MARHFSLPSFLSTPRSKVITVATAGTLTLAAAVSAAAVALPASSAASATADAAFLPATSQQAAAQTARPAAGGNQSTVLFYEARALQAKRFEQRVATAKAADNAAATRKAKAAAQKAAQPAKQPQPVPQAASVTVPSGSSEQVAEHMLSQFGWSSSQFSCLQPLWQQESGWNLTAENPSSGAYGIPQALPGSRMASSGPDWQTDAATQIRWGLAYIQSRYGSPCGAWTHEEADGWY